MQHDIRTAVCLFYVLNLELRAAVAAPLHSLCAIFVAACDDVYLLAHHERRVEAEAEVSDDSIGVVLVLVEEVGNARECDLVDIFLYFISCHTKTIINEF